MLHAPDFMVEGLQILPMTLIFYGSKTGPADARLAGPIPTALREHEYSAHLVYTPGT